LVFIGGPLPTDVLTKWVFVDSSNQVIKHQMF
jgi:hypothetical protein